MRWHFKYQKMHLTQLQLSQGPASSPMLPLRLLLCSHWRRMDTSRVWFISSVPGKKNHSLEVPSSLLLRRPTSPELIANLQHLQLNEMTPRWQPEAVPNYQGKNRPYSRILIAGPGSSRTLLGFPFCRNQSNEMKGGSSLVHSRVTAWPGARMQSLTAPQQD